MALFGYPRAQENDAQRAVRAALAIQRALAGLNERNARSGAPENPVGGKPKSLKLAGLHLLLACFDSVRQKFVEGRRDSPRPLWR